MGLCLDITPRNLEKVLYFAAYIVTDPGDTDLAYKEILTEQQYREKKRRVRRQIQGCHGSRGHQNCFWQR